MSWNDLLVTPTYHEEILSLLSLVVSKNEISYITVNIYEAKGLFGSNCIIARSNCSIRWTSLSAEIIGEGHMLLNGVISDWGK